jgi:hypothetical protein
VPNGHDREWIRLCLAVEGFRSRYRRWPTRVRLFPGCLKVIRDDLLTPAGYALVAARVELVPDEGAPYIAEDADGLQFNYGTGEATGKPDITGGTAWVPDVGAEEWFGHPEIRPDLEAMKTIRFYDSKGNLVHPKETEATKAERGVAMSRDSILDVFSNLRRRTGGPESTEEKALHKPILVLYALGRWRHGEDRLSFAASAGDLDSLLQDFGSVRNPHFPFWRLKNDHVWEVTWDGPADAEQPSRKELVDGGCRGGFSDVVLAALRSEAGFAEELAKRMLENFPAEQHGAIRERVGLSESTEV